METEIVSLLKSL